MESQLIHVGGSDLLGVAHMCDDEFIAVGRTGACYRRVRGAWLREDTGLSEDLYGVAADGGNVWAVGGNLDIGGQSKVCEWDGVDWTVRPSGVQSLLLAVTARDGEVWACGFNGDLVRRTGTGWQQHTGLDRFGHLFGCALGPSGAPLVAGLDGWCSVYQGGRWSSHKVGSSHVFGLAAGAGDVRW